MYRLQMIVLVRSLSRAVCFRTNEQRGMFLKKLWCCIVGRVQQDYLVLSTDLKTLISHHKEFEADVSGVSPSSSFTLTKG